MTVTEKTTHISHRINDGVCGINIRRPVVENCRPGKKLNSFFEKLSADFTAFAKKHGFKFITVSDLIAYRLEQERFVQKINAKLDKI